MKFTEYELLELFDDKKVFDKEVYRAEYYIKYDDDFLFTLYILPCEDYATVTLSKKNIDTFIFDIGLRNIEKIICKENKLFFYKLDNNEEPFLIVQVGPSVSLSFNA